MPYVIMTNKLLDAAVTVKHVVKFDMLIFKDSHYSRIVFITLKHLHTVLLLFNVSIKLKSK